MKRAVTAAGVIVAITAPLSAHRLDEYLQASRVSLSHASIALEVDLTPGASVADEVVAQIDRDRNGSISPLEAKSYAERALSEIDIELDGHAVDMTLIHAEMPSIDEMRQGLGTIQLRGVANVAPASIWRQRRQLHVRNNHHPRSSVYLVNATIPNDDGVRIAAQTRDTTQRLARIDYVVSPQWPKYVYWPLFGLVVGGWWLVKGRAHEPLTAIHYRPTTNH